MATLKATPRMRYHSHKASAKARGIEFDMTFEEWWAIWEPHYDGRGPGKAGLQMCRTGDDGAYRPGNVRIDTGANNLAELRTSQATKAMRRDWLIEGQDRSELHTWMTDRKKCWGRDPRKLLQATEESKEDEDECEKS